MTKQLIQIVSDSTVKYIICVQDRLSSRTNVEGLKINVSRQQKKKKVQKKKKIQTKTRCLNIAQNSFNAANKRVYLFI